MFGVWLFWLNGNFRGGLRFCGSDQPATWASPTTPRPKLSQTARPPWDCLRMHLAAPISAKRRRRRFADPSPNPKPQHQNQDNNAKCEGCLLLLPRLLTRPCPPPKTTSSHCIESLFHRIESWLFVATFFRSFPVFPFDISTQPFAGPQGRV